MTFERIELVWDGPVLRAWLDRPDKRNAHDRAMVEEVGDLFVALNTTYGVRVCVLGGRGPTFCAGADRREQHRAAVDEREARYIGRLGRRATRAIEECDVPTIARVHGHAAGGGSCFAVSCDFRITTDSTQFWVPEVDLGTPLPWSAVPRLIQEIGMARARRYVMLAERIDGRTAADWGLAHESVADEGELDAAVDRLVARILELPALAIDMTKSQFRGYSRGMALGDLSESDGDLRSIAARSPAFKERFGRF